MSFKFSTTTLNTILNFSNGKSSPERFENGKCLVFGANGVIGRANETNTPSNSIVVGRVGSYCGAVHFSKGACWVTDNAIKATAKDNNDPSFLYYLLKQLNLNNWRSGSGQPLINQSTLNSIEVCIPRPVEQREIGNLISSLDARITLLRDTNATLEAIAQALFKSWFVDFDPVRAKQDGREPEGMDEATAALFPDSFEESELGLVPKGWRVGPILDIARLLSGGTPKTDRPEYWGGGVAWASAKDVSQSSDSFLVETDRTITQLGLEKSATRMIPALSTVVVARGATTGQMVLLGNAMAMNQTCYALESKTATPIALYCQLRREIDVVVSAAHGSIFDTITTSTFAESKIVQPVQPLLKHFEEIVAPLFQQILIGTRASRTLAALRDNLLPRLISGQLHLPDIAEENIELLTGT